MFEHEGFRNRNAGIGEQEISELLTLKACGRNVSTVESGKIAKDDSIDVKEKLAARLQNIFREMDFLYEAAEMIYRFSKKAKQKEPISLTREDFDGAFAEYKSKLTVFNSLKIRVDRILNILIGQSLDQLVNNPEERSRMTKGLPFGINKAIFIAEAFSQGPEIFTIK